ncbi:MAG: YlbF family regulator [Chloroflexota bacterium]|nr:MAG: YlbF family regulator [Chloroflexota bacterium]
MNQNDDRTFEDLEIASTSVVMQAARDFAAALSETPQLAAFEKTALAFRQDSAAQQALQAVQEKQKSLRGLQMLNALSAEQRNELESLENAFTNLPVVQEYFAAEAELTSLCQVLGDALSGSIGLNYAAACGSSCCG